MITLKKGTQAVCLVWYEFTRNLSANLYFNMTFTGVKTELTNI